MKRVVLLLGHDVAELGDEAAGVGGNAAPQFVDVRRLRIDGWCACQLESEDDQSANEQTHLR